MLSRLERVICHNGLVTAPEHTMAAVKNLGQCMHVRSSKSPCWKYESWKKIFLYCKHKFFGELAFFEYNECKRESRGG
jgi:hypothetical protein